MGDLVTYSLERGVATIAMDDGKANALSVSMLAELHAAFEQANGDGAAVVLAGRPGRFSGGFHLPTIQAGGQERDVMLRSGFDLAVRMLSFPSAVVVACTGHAVAQAAIVLLCGDERIGAEGQHKIVFNETAIGLWVGRSMIEIGRHRLNPTHLHRVFVLAEEYLPDRAVEAGFLDRVVAPGDVVTVAQEAALRYAALDPGAVAGTKARLCEDVVQRLQALVEREFPD